MSVMKAPAVRMLFAFQRSTASNVHALPDSSQTHILTANVPESTAVKTIPATPLPFAKQSLKGSTAVALLITSGIHLLWDAELRELAAAMTSVRKDPPARTEDVLTHATMLAAATRFVKSTKTAKLFALALQDLRDPPHLIRDVFVSPLVVNPMLTAQVACASGTNVKSFAVGLVTVRQANAVCQACVCFLVLVICNAPLVKLVPEDSV